MGVPVVCNLLPHCYMLLYLTLWSFDPEISGASTPSLDDTAICVTSLTDSKSGVMLICLMVTNELTRLYQMISKSRQREKAARQLGRYLVLIQLSNRHFTGVWHPAGVHFRSWTELKRGGKRRRKRHLWRLKNLTCILLWPSASLRVARDVFNRRFIQKQWDKSVFGDRDNLPGLDIVVHSRDHGLQDPEGLRVICQGVFVSAKKNKPQSPQSPYIIQPIKITFLN